MFQLTRNEFDNLMSQIMISSSGNYGGRRKLPLVFTEQGVAMLSSVLNSDRAVQVNIAIMRAFVNIRKMAFNQRRSCQETNRDREKDRSSRRGIRSDTSYVESAG